MLWLMTEEIGNPVPAIAKAEKRFVPSVSIKSTTLIIKMFPVCAAIFQIAERLFPAALQAHVHVTSAS